MPKRHEGELPKVIVGDQGDGSTAETIMDLGDDAHETFIDLGASQRGVEHNVLERTAAEQEHRARTAARREVIRSVEKAEQERAADELAKKIKGTSSESRVVSDERSIKDLAREAGILEEEMERLRDKLSKNGLVVRFLGRERFEKKLAALTSEHDAVVKQMHRQMRGK